MNARHRNNAAEWVLWALLLPLVPIAWLIERLRRSSRDDRPGQSTLRVSKHL